MSTGVLLQTFLALGVSAIVAIRAEKGIAPVISNQVVKEDYLVQCATQIYLDLYQDSPDAQAHWERLYLSAVSGQEEVLHQELAALAIAYGTENLPEEEDEEDIPLPVESPVEALERSLLDALAHFGKKIEIIDRQLGPSQVQFYIMPTDKTRGRTFKGYDTDLQVRMALEHRPFIESTGRGICVSIPRSDRQFPDLVDYVDRSTPEKGFMMPIGIDMSGDPVEIDLSNPDTPHLLIGGTTGSGKSMTARACLSGLCRRYSPKHLNLALVEPLKSELDPFEDNKWSWNKTKKARTEEESIALFRNAVTEMNRRYIVLRNQAATNINEVDGIPHLVIWVEEFSQLLSNAEKRKELEAAVIQIAQAGRAAGIHLVMSTQRPSADVVTPLIRANLPCRLALRVAQKTESSIILGRDGDTRAMYLLGKGDGWLILPGKPDTRIQGYFVKNEDL